MCARFLIGVVLGMGLLTTSAAATADSANARMFQGKTDQGYRIKLNVKESRLKILRFEADLRCTDGSLLTLIESGFLWTRAGSGGSFRDAQFGRTDKVSFRGRLTETASKVACGLPTSFARASNAARSGFGLTPADAERRHVSRRVGSRGGSTRHRLWRLPGRPAGAWRAQR